MELLTEEQRTLFLKYKNKYDVKEVIGISKSEMKNLTDDKLVKKINKFVERCLQKEKEESAKMWSSDSDSDDAIHEEKELDANGKPFLYPRNTLYFLKKGM